MIDAGKLAISNSLIKGDSIEEASKKAIIAFEEAVKNYNPRIRYLKKKREVENILDKWKNDENIKNDIFTKELDINDYPENVRLKISKRDFKLKIQEITNCEVKVKGIYVKSSSKVPIGVKRLCLYVKGNSESDVNNAILEISRMINTWAISSLNNEKPNNKYVV